MLDPYKKPWPYQKINWAHPLAKGLVGCLVMNEGSGVKAHNLANASISGAIGSTISWTQGLDGSGLYWPDPTTVVNTSIQIDNIFDFQLGHSQFVICKRINIVNSNYPFLNDKDDGNWGDTDGFYFGLKKEGGSLLKIGQNETSTVVAHTTDELLHSAACSWNPDVWAKLYFDGKETTAYDNQNVTASYVKSANTAKIGVYYDEADARTFHGTLFLSYVWNRALTCAEIASLHTNPYQIFEPSIQPWMGYVAPIGGTWPTGNPLQIRSPLGGPI